MPMIKKHLPHGLLELNLTKWLLPSIVAQKTVLLTLMEYLIQQMTTSMEVFQPMTVVLSDGLYLTVIFIILKDMGLMRALNILFQLQKMEFTHWYWSFLRFSSNNQGRKSSMWRLETKLCLKILTFLEKSSPVAYPMTNSSNWRKKAANYS